MTAAARRTLHEEAANMKKSRKSIVSTVILILVFLVGLSLLLYPTVSDYWNSLHQSRAIASYAGQVAGLDDEVYEALWAEAEAYNETLPDKADRFNMSEEELEFITGETDLDKGVEAVRARYDIPLICITMGKGGSRASDEPV